MVKELKKQLRQTIRQLRQSLSSEAQHQYNEQIQKTLLSLPQFQAAKNILFYASLPEEVATLEIVEKHLHSKNIILPRVEEHQLVLHHLKDIQHLHKGRFEILEPIIGSAVVDPSTIDLAIIPGLAFDEQKNRLGFGKGYYDKLLPLLPCRKIGLAYECQMVKDVPSEDHDQPLDMIITEQRLIK